VITVTKCKTVYHPSHYVEQGLKTALQIGRQSFKFLHKGSLVAVDVAQLLACFGITCGRNDSSVR